MRMNILYVSSKKGWGGVVSWMHRTALGLESRGHKVWVVSHPDSRLTLSAPAGVRIIPKRLGMDYNPVMILYLAGLIRRNRIGVVVTNIQKEITVGGSAAKIAGARSIRRIGNEHDINPRFRWRQKHLVDHTIAPSKSVLDKAGETVDWMDPARYTVIYNGRNPVAPSAEDISAKRREWGLSEKDFIIGCTGQLARVKGIDRLIGAFKAFSEYQADARLVITGEGPELESLKRTMSLQAEADRSPDILVEDRFMFSGAAMAVEEAFLTWLPVHCEGPRASLTGTRSKLELTIEKPKDTAFSVQELKRECEANAKTGRLKRLSFGLRPKQGETIVRVRMRILPIEDALKDDC